MEKKSLTLISLLLAVYINAFSVSNSHSKGSAPTQKSTISAVDSLAPVDTALIKDEFFKSIFNAKLDSLTNEWYVRNAFNIDSLNYGDTSLTNLMDDSGFEIPDSEKIVSNIPDSIIIQRLQDLNSYIDLSYNPMVKNIIGLWTGRRKAKLQIMLGLSYYYFPMIEETFDKYDLPVELKYMAVIESALNPLAYSRVGACGLWQFMYGTGKMYNLEINSFVDERRDPVKATDAAARYLKDLYNIYGDWHLVIAAYNYGPGNVNRAIARSGGKLDYWSVYYRLPKETREYVPAFIAAAYFMNYNKQHGIAPVHPSFNLTTDTVMVRKYIHLSQVAKELGIDINMLREINPMYRRDIIPAKPDKPYPLRLPPEYISRFIENEQQILACERDKYFPNNQIKDPVKESTKYAPVDVKGKDKVLYTVKAGDNVGYIADWFHIRLSDLRYWNDLNGNMIRTGQSLVIYVSQGKGEYYQGFNQMSFDEKQKTIGKEVVPETTTASVQKPTTTIDTNFVYYKVRQGDNLWVIAKKFPGVSADDIKKLNNITNTRSLYIGQTLKIQPAN